MEVGRRLGRDVKESEERRRRRRRKIGNDKRGEEAKVDWERIKV